MIDYLPKKIFVVGTDTGVGKTVISAMLTKSLSGTYWKPIQTGMESDTEWVRRYTNLPDENFLPETYRFSNPLSPHAAATIEGVTIDLNLLKLPEVNNHLIIEGVGGVLVPLNEKDLLVDLIKKWNIPVLIVTRSTLGTINHTLLTLQALRSHHISIFGVVLNGPKNRSNKEAIEKYGKIPIIKEIIYDNLASVYTDENSPCTIKSKVGEGSCLNT